MFVLDCTGHAGADHPDWDVRKPSRAERGRQCLYQQPDKRHTQRLGQLVLVPGPSRHLPGLWTQTILFEL